jgi:cytochrome P450 family 9
MYVIIDLELIKQITIKDFNSFVDHRQNLDSETHDKLFGQNLFLIKGQRWRDARNTLR